MGYIRRCGEDEKMVKIKMFGWDDYLIKILCSY